MVVERGRLLLIIAIDGPAGSGKSTISRMLAQRLGFMYVDTGAVYRAVTLKVINSGVDMGDEDEMCRLIDDTRIALRYDDGKLTVFLDGDDVSLAIREPSVTNKIAFISNKASVRKKLIRHQKECADGIDAVVEGRDIGSVIFPDADKKFFLSADVAERARRRYTELVERGLSVEYEDILSDIKIRDAGDSTRDAAPLQQVDDAVFIDTTNESIDDVVDRVCKIVGL